jgi:hypothetical protein
MPGIIHGENHPKIALFASFIMSATILYRTSKLKDLSTVLAGELSLAN